MVGIEYRERDVAPADGSEANRRRAPLLLASSAMRKCVIAALVALSGCAGEPAETMVVPFGSAFSVRRISVQENRTDLVVAPRIRAEADGFLYTDYAESRVRRYDLNGQLQWASGGKGEGPSEYSRPSDVGRLPDGRILVFEYNGRMTVLSPDGSTVLDTRPRRFRSLEEAEVINDTLLLVAADRREDVPGDPERPMLHIWNWQRDTILTSFFRPFASTPHTDVFRMASWVRADLRGDTIAAIHPAADSVFLFSLDGVRIAALPLRIQGYVEPTPAPANAASDMSARREWIGSFDLISEVEWLPNGDVVVAYRRQKIEGLEWHVVLVPRSSSRALQVLHQDVS